jgi:hypothetical protein
MGRIFAGFMAAALCVLGGWQPARAGDSPGERLYELVRLDETVEILRDEGLAYVLENRAVILAQAGREAEWEAAMRTLYDLEAQQALVRAAFLEAIPQADAEALIPVVESAGVQKAVALELSARRAFIAPGVEETARDALRTGPDGPHATAIAAIVAANDLVERNTAATLNANYLFLRALAGPDGPALEGHILADVWAAEEETRADTGEWLLAFMSMAYEPLSAGEMAAYVALWQSPEGKALNRAIFAGFEPMFSAAATGIGETAARFLAEPDL